MKKIILFVLFFFTASKLLSQESIGFQNPENIQPILDYRLPDWGYSNFFMDVQFNGMGSYQENQDLSEDTEEFLISGTPGYRLYRESEKRIWSLNSIAIVNYNSREEQPDEIFETIFNLDSNFQNYWANNIYFNFDLPLNLDYRYTEESAPDVLTYERRFTARPRLGIGIGRIRNVNPVIRALRLRERLNALNANYQLSKEDLLTSADHLSRYDGYQQKYDRPDKYFWRDLDRKTSISLSGLPPYDLFYLNDLFDEAIGTRLEGWIIGAGGIYSYINNLEREEQFLVVDRSLNSNEMAGVYLEGSWYHNLSLKHQIGLSFDITKNYFLNSDANESNFNSIATFNWLWNITDRFLLQSTFLNLYSKFDSDLRDTWLNNTSLASSLFYFVENRIAINLLINTSLIHTDTDNRFIRWTSQAGIRYYFSRNLY